MVPASAGLSHSVWDAPDRRGHRFRVSVRRVSRYEPLVRWWKRLHRPIEIPNDMIIVEDTVADATAKSLTLVRDKKKPLPQLHPYQYPLRLEITKGDGAGQNRIVVDYRHKDSDNTIRTTFDIDPGDPWLQLPEVGESRCRVFATSDFSKLIEMPPALDEQRGEGPRPLTVYQYPHSTRVQFSYQIPPQGARSIYNQISQIRTGYCGVDLVFRYFLLDRASDDPQRIDALQASLVRIESDLPEPLELLKDIAVNDTTRLRLFRHERLVTLPDLPFFYRYRLDVRSEFAMRQLERDFLTDAELLPLDPNLSPPAERGPARLMVRQPEILEISASQPRQFDIKIHLSTVGDHLTLSEQQHEPNPLEVRFTPQPADPSGTAESEMTIKAGELPDYTLDYALDCRSQSPSPSSDSSDTFIQASWVRLPWSKDFQPDEGQPVTMPYVDLSDGLNAQVEWGYLVVNHQTRTTVAVLLKDMLPNEWWRTTRVFSVVAVSDSVRWSTDDIGTGTTIEKGNLETFGPEGNQVLTPDLRIWGENPGAIVRLRVQSDADVTPFTNSKLSVPIEIIKPAGGKGPSYRISFRLTVDDGREQFAGKDRYFLQGSRDGVPTYPIQFLNR